jgi:hypothetical protein
MTISLADRIAPALKDPEVVAQRDIRECEQRRLRRCALGFLLSYAAMIKYESDFLIAKEKHLLPAEVKWSAWRTFITQILNTEHIYEEIDTRFIYGELLLSRLNMIYYLSQFRFLHGYVAYVRPDEGFFQKYFALLASATVYIVVVLTAMQVGLATKFLADSNAFQSISYGFAVFSIVAPVITVGLVGGFSVLAFCYMFLLNMLAVILYKEKRLKQIRLTSASVV